MDATNESSVPSNQTEQVDAMSVDQTPTQTTGVDTAIPSQTKPVPKAVTATSNTTSTSAKAASVKEPEQRTIDPEIQVLLEKLREEAKKGKLNELFHFSFL